MQLCHVQGFVTPAACASLRYCFLMERAIVSARVRGVLIGMGWQRSLSTVGMSLNGFEQLYNVILPSSLAL